MYLWVLVWFFQHNTAFQIIFFFFFVFLGLHMCHMEVPRVGVESELQLPAYTTATATPDLNYVFDLHLTATHSNSRSLTHWARLGIKPTSS